MPEFELDEVARRHPARLALAAVPQPQVESRSVVEALRVELDSYYEMAKRWANSEPDEVLMQLSALTARLTEVRAHLNRDNGQKANRLRISEIDPLLEECDRQFKIHSRLIAMRQLDWEVVRGAET